MAQNAYGSIASMVGKGSGTGPVPTQGFQASNVFGTVIPQVGDARATPTPSVSNVGGTSSKQVVVVVLVLIAIGYLFYHLSFEK